MPSTPALAPALQPIRQTTVELRPSLTAFIGANDLLAAYVSATTGEPIIGEYRTCGFADDAGGALALVIHGVDDRREGRLSLVDGGFRHCRDALLTVGIATLCEMGLSALFVRIRPRDLSARAALQRLGFVIAGRERLSNGERVVLRVSLDTLPDHWRRWLQRRAS